jgi:hypothetical protein
MGRQRISIARVSEATVAGGLVAFVVAAACATLLITMFFSLNS